MEPVGVFEIACLHPAHPDVAEDRKQPDRVKRPAPGGRPQLGARADRELDHPDLEELGEKEMPSLMWADQQQEHASDADDVEKTGQELAHLAPNLPEVSFTYSLAQRSASRISCSVFPPPGKASRARSTVRTMPLKGISPARKAVTASSFAAFRTAGRPLPALAASRARRTAGNRFSSRGGGRLHRVRKPVGVAEGHRDRKAHVRAAQLGLERAVDELHE